MTHDGTTETEAGGASDAPIVLTAVVLQVLAAPVASAAEPARLALFDLELVDSSLQGEMAGADPADERACA